jgi:hypothetical protein
MSNEEWQQQNRPGRQQRFNKIKNKRGRGGFYYLIADIIGWLGLVLVLKGLALFSASAEMHIGQTAQHTCITY